jgi:hypothetical protein
MCLLPQKWSATWYYRSQKIQFLRPDSPLVFVVLSSFLTTCQMYQTKMGRGILTAHYATPVSPRLLAEWHFMKAKFKLQVTLKILCTAPHTHTHTHTKYSRNNRMKSQYTTPRSMAQATGKSVFSHWLWQRFFHQAVRHNRLLDPPSRVSYG